MVLIVGILLLAIASLVALAYAIVHAEEGFEDSTGYHRKQHNGIEHNNEEMKPTSSTVDTGNPWDQIEGASCPINLGESFRPLGHGNFSTHQP